MKSVQTSLGSDSIKVIPSRSKVRVEEFSKVKLDSADEVEEIPSEELLQLLPYRPALHHTWKGRITEFSGYFWCQPAVNIRKKSYRLCKAMPYLLKAELIPTWYNLKDLFKNKSPKLSDVEIYIFQNQITPSSLKEEDAYPVNRDVMIRLYIQGTMLLIFSSKLLDNTSQFIINTQARTENFLWGFFDLPKSRAILPQTAYQIDDTNVVEMGIETEKDMVMSQHTTSSEALKLVTDSPNTCLSASGKKI